MTYSQVTLTFNDDLSINDKVILRTGLDSSSIQGVLTEQWVNFRSQSYQVSLGTPTAIAGERSAINYVTAFNLDFNAFNFYQVSRVDNVVTIRALFTFINFFEPTTPNPNDPNGPYDALPDDVDINITNFSGTLFTIDSVVLSEATTNPACSHYKVTITTSDTASSISSPIAVPSNTDNPIVFEVLRGQGFVFNATYSDGQTVNTTRLPSQVPDILNTATISVIISNSPNGATVIVSSLQSTNGGNSLEYSLDNSTWQTSNVFTGLADDDYTMYVRDSYGCSFTYDFTVSYGAIYTPFSYYSKHNSIRMAEVVTFGNCGPYPVDENTLSNEAFAKNQRLARKECQAFQTCDSIPCQLLSNYSNISVTIIDGETETPLVLTQQTNNIGRKDARDAFKYNLGNGKTGVYFTTGNIYDYDTNTDTGQDYSLNGGLPEWVKIGVFFSIDNAWFEIENIIFDEDLEYEVIVINAIYTGLPTPIITKCIYNRQDYEVYEYSVNMALYENKTIQVKTVETDQNFDTKTRISELIHVKEVHKYHAEIISYSTNNNDIFYASGIKHKVRMLLQDKKGQHEDESEVNKGDEKSGLIESKLYELDEFTFGPMTKEIYRMLVRQLSNKIVLIDGVQYIKNASIEVEGPLEESNLYLVKAIMLRADNGFNTNGSNQELISNVENLEVPNLTITNDGDFIVYQ